MKTEKQYLGPVFFEHFTKEFNKKNRIKKLTWLGMHGQVVYSNLDQQRTLHWNKFLFWNSWVGEKLTQQWENELLHYNLNYKHRMVNAMKAYFKKHGSTPIIHQ
jgi:hypothetical protein